MSRVLTGDKLVESIRNRAMIPDDTSVYTDDNLLDIANEELDVQLLDKLLSLHEEHLTTHIDIPRSETGVYNIPYRAIGNKLRDIQMFTGGSNYELAQISLGELSDYTYDSSTQNYGMDKFYVESNQIKLLQPTRTYDFIRVYFYIRPNVLTKVEKAGVISSITKDELNDELVVNFTTMPSNFTSNLSYDLVGFRSPNKIKAYDLTAKEVNTGTKTMKFVLSELTEVADDLIVGDYVCEAEQSPVPNIPTEMHPVLAQLAAVHVLEAMGDTEGLNNAQRRLDKMNSSVMSLVDDRVELAPKKIKPRNGTISETRNTSRRRRGR